jgi:hypothetical protein
LAVGGIASLAFTGCQVDVGGQTLPSAYYLQDDIQYFPAGPEFKLSKEAAAQKAYKKEIGPKAAVATAAARAVAAATDPPGEARRPLAGLGGAAKLRPVGSKPF